MRKPIIWAYSYSGPCANMNQGSFVASRYFFNFNTNGQSCCHSSTVGETVNNNHYTETCTKHILLPHTYIWAVLKVRFVFTSAPNSGMNWMSTCILLNSAPHQIWMFASNSLHEKQWSKQRWLRMVKTKESSKLLLLLSVMFDSTPISEFLISINVSLLPSVLWRCWLGGRKGIRPIKNWAVGC